jgi:hypothetical protein
VRSEALSGAKWEAPHITPGLEHLSSRAADVYRIVWEYKERTGGIAPEVDELDVLTKHDRTYARAAIEELEDIGYLRSIWLKHRRAPRGLIVVGAQWYPPAWWLDRFRL